MCDTKARGPDDKACDENELHIIWVTHNTSHTIRVTNSRVIHCDTKARGPDDKACYENEFHIIWVIQYESRTLESRVMRMSSTLCESHTIRVTLYESPSFVCHTLKCDTFVMRCEASHQLGDQGARHKKLMQKCVTKMRYTLHKPLYMSHKLSQVAYMWHRSTGNSWQSVLCEWVTHCMGDMLHESHIWWLTLHASHYTSHELSSPTCVTQRHEDLMTYIYESHIRRLTLHESNHMSHELSSHTYMTHRHEDLMWKCVMTMSPTLYVSHTNRLTLHESHYKGHELSIDTYVTHRHEDMMRKCVMRISHTFDFYMSLTLIDSLYTSHTTWTTNSRVPHMWHTGTRIWWQSVSWEWVTYFYFIWVTH